MRAWGGVLLAAGWLLAAPAPAHEPPAEALLATLPFQDWPEPNRVVVDLAPEGQRGLTLMLDTGAQACAMTPRMARSLGVTVRRTKSTPYRKKTILGRDMQFWVDTTRSDTGSAQFEYGLLGGEFLDDYVVEIDFPGRIVRFFDRKKYEVPETVEDTPDEAVVPLKITSARPFVELLVDGNPVRVLLDTGAPFTVGLSGKSARKIGIDVEALPEWHDVQFVHGPTSQRLYEAPRFGLGGFEWTDFPITVLPRGAYNLGGSTDSLLGYDVLRPFVIRIDYKRRRMWMKRKEPLEVTYLGADWKLRGTIGALLTPLSGVLYVWQVDSQGPAHVYGLRGGDRIASLSGEGPPDAAEVARRILAREELTAIRTREGLDVDVLLPEAAPPD